MLRSLWTKLAKINVAQLATTVSRTALDVFGAGLVVLAVYTMLGVGPAALAAGVACFAIRWLLDK